MPLRVAGLRTHRCRLWLCRQPEPPGPGRLANAHSQRWADRPATSCASLQRDRLSLCGTRTGRPFGRRAGSHRVYADVESTSLRSNHLSSGVVSAGSVNVRPLGWDQVDGETSWSGTAQRRRSASTVQTSMGLRDLEFHAAEVGDYNRAADAFRLALQNAA